MKVLIIYHTKTGHTLEAAEKIAEGIRSGGSEAAIVSVKEFNAGQISEYDGFIAGSPCWAGSLGVGGTAGPVVKALKSLQKNALADKKCGCFSLYGMKGGETTLKHLNKLLSGRGSTSAIPGLIAKAGTPASLTKGPDIKAEDLKRFEEFGRNFVK